MAADANIFAQYLKPPRSVMDYQNEYQQADMNRNQLAESNMGLAEKQRAVASENALARAISGGGDVAKQLAEQGFGKQSIAYTKAQQDSLKQKSEIGHLDAQSGKLKADTTGAGLDQSIKAHDYHVQLLGAVSDPQSAQAWAVEGLKSGVFTPEQFARGFTNIPTDPAGFGQWKQQAMQGGVTGLTVWQRLPVSGKHQPSKLARPGRTTLQPLPD